jgi:hypothetical protein
MFEIEIEIESGIRILLEIALVSVLAHSKT